MSQSLKYFFSWMILTLLWALALGGQRWEFPQYGQPLLQWVFKAESRKSLDWNHR